MSILRPSRIRKRTPGRACQNDAMTTSDGFEEAFDRAAAEGQQLRAHQRLAPGEHASGTDVARRLRRLDSTERAGAGIDQLAARAQAGDTAARERLIARMLPVVSRSARPYQGRDVDRSDLLQEGIVGVLRALERYDAGRGVPFAAYALWWIRQAMQQTVAEQARAVRLPTHLLWDLHDMREARERPENQGLSDAELGRRLGWSEGRAADVLRAERPAVSLDAPHMGDDGAAGPMGELLADPLSEDGYEQTLTALTGQSIRALLTTLTDRERQVLAWRFGLDGEELSLRQIGRRLGMSAERVRQIEQRALAKLRTSSTSVAAGG
jgi:RNA polymerase sigma factor (sigma-70 family)